MNGHYMRAMADDDLLKALLDTLPHLEQGGALAAKLAGPDADALRAQLRAAMPGLKERAKTLVELLDGARYLYADRPLPLEAKAAEILDNGGRAHVAALAPKLEAMPEWTAAAAEAVVRAYSEEAGAKLGAVAQPLRAALTGRTTSPGVFDVLETLGRAESVARLRDQAG